VVMDWVLIEHLSGSEFKLYNQWGFAKKNNCNLKKIMKVQVVNKGHVSLAWHVEENGRCIMIDSEACRVGRLLQNHSIDWVVRVSYSI